jgi:cytochrome P450
MARRVPPGPSRYFVLNKSYRTDRLAAFERDWKNYGDVYRIKAVPGIDVYVVTHPDDVQQVLQGHGRTYRKSPTVHEPLALLLGRGILISEGETWLRQRRMMQPVFRHESLLRLAETMTRIIHQRVSHWERYPHGTVIDVVDQMQQLTMEIAATTLFGADLGSEANVFPDAFRQAAAFIDDRLNRVIRWPIWLPTRRHRRFRRDRKTLERIVQRIIESRRRQSEPRDDLLSLLIAERDEDTGQGMTDRELHDQAMTLLIAGHETVSVTLAWAFHLLSTHGHCLEKLQAELRAALGDRLAQPSDLPKLGYARMIIQETMRLYPPVWALARQAIADDELGGYPIASKTLLMLPTFFTHRHPDFWPQPDVFDPERFTDEQVARRHKFAHYPFGGGPRICIGNHFAMMESALILSAIVQRFVLVPSGDLPVEIDPTFTLRPKNGLSMKLLRSPKPKGRPTGGPTMPMSAT